MNYEKIFTDPDIIRAFVVTFKYAIFDVPLKLMFALFIAYILNFKLKGVNFFRTAYYIPSILGGSIAIAILWRAVFNTDGLINTVLGAFGIPEINWMAGDMSALMVIVLLRVWQFGSAMVIFLAALKGVSEDLYEAASIDGAGKWTQFFKITVPLITPVIFYNLVTQLCQAFQEFNGPFLVTKGGPKRSNHPDLHADLQQRIPSPQDGYGKRPGVDPVLDYYDHDRCCICQPEEVGLLFR